MKAIIQTQYGGPEVYSVQNLANPVPKSNEVLVNVHASAINDYDWSMMRGKPFIYRLMFGLIKPKANIAGMELSGVVEAVGKHVSQFKVGQHVFGDISEHGFGAFAQKVCVHEHALVLKPAFLSFNEAAGMSHAAMLAWQSLMDIADIENRANNKKVKLLVNGAGGGMGMFALIIAKHFNAEVTGVDATDKLSALTQLGFDHVIDYTQTDFTEQLEQYDIILDAKTKRSPFAFLKALSKKSIYITVGGDLPRLIQLLCVSPYIKKRHNQTFKILGLKSNKGLEAFCKMYEQSSIKMIIDGPHPLEKTAELIQYFGEAKHIGKIIMNHQDANK